MNPKAKFVLFMLILLGILSVELSHGQSEIKNFKAPDDHQNKRIIQLKEVLQVKDEGDRFYFKEPRTLQIADNGSILVLDGVDRLYKFSPQGSFDKNLVKKGRGPGEILEIMNFILTKSEIILFDGMENKLIHLNYEGELLHELRLSNKRFFNQLTVFNDFYYMVDFNITNFKRETGVYDVGRNLFIVGKNGGISSTPYDFQVKNAVIFRNGAVAVSPVNEIQLINMGMNDLYFNHNSEYLIKKFSLKEKMVTLSFRREYKRVRYKHPPESGNEYNKFHNDIQKLLVYRGNLWVLTSTLDSDLGILTDVFDSKENFIESCWLSIFDTQPRPILEPSPLGYPPMNIKGNFMYALITTEDHNILLQKYHILENSRQIEDRET